MKIAVRCVMYMVRLACLAPRNKHSLENLQPASCGVHAL